jgi:hypothetical protein
VYHDFFEKDNEERKRKAPTGNYSNLEQKQLPRYLQPPPQRSPFEAYDPMKKFAKDEDSMKATMADGYRTYSEFNSYKNPKGGNSKAP